MFFHYSPKSSTCFSNLNLWAIFPHLFNFWFSPNHFFLYFLDRSYKHNNDFFFKYLNMQFHQVEIESFEFLHAITIIGYPQYFELKWMKFYHNFHFYLLWVWNNLLLWNLQRWNWMLNWYYDDGYLRSKIFALCHTTSKPFILVNMQDAIINYTEKSTQKKQVSISLETSSHSD